MTDQAEARTQGFRQRWETWRRLLARHDGIGLRAQLVVFAGAMLLIFLRKPDLLLHAQFYAEDGAVWYAQAYNLGWLHSLTLADGGYLNTLQRLAAGLALLVPLQFAPLVMNVIGTAVQALPANVLLSRRAASWGSLPMRTMMAAMYLLLPNALEVHVVLTNAQWRWGLALALLVLGVPAVTALEQVANALVVVIGSVSGPFALLLLPLMLVRWWVTRQRWMLVQMALIVPGVLVQVYCLLTTVRLPAKPLGASVALFCRLVGVHVFLESLTGASRYAPQVPFAVCLLSLILGVALLVLGIRRAGLNLGLLALFATAVLLAGLKSPLITGVGPLWEQLMMISGQRYDFYLILVFFWSVLWCAVAVDRRVRRMAQITLCLMSVAVVRQFYYKPTADHHFAEYAARFEAARAGETITIPLYPGAVEMSLIRK